MDREKGQLGRGTIAVLAFNIIYLSVASFFALSRNNYEFVLYIGIVIVVGFILTGLHFSRGLTLPILWCMSVWGFFHMSGGLLYIPPSLPYAGDINVLYNLWIVPDYLKFDQLVHAYGFGITTWLIWMILQSSIFMRTDQTRYIEPTFGLLFLCVIASMGLGALNEVLEFVATLSVPETNVGGYLNTCWDLVFNTLGAMIASVVIYEIDRSKNVANGDLNFKKGEEL